MTSKTMFKDGKQLSQIDDTVSTEENIPGSSISFTIRENSVHIKEKSKPVNEANLPVIQKKEQWWIKKPTTQLEIGGQINILHKNRESPVLSPDASSSMKDFLNKEKMCNDEVKMKEKDDTLNELLASVGFDKYQSDLENATDEDIGSILEEMSKAAVVISPVADSVESKTLSEILTEEERSVEELLKEADILVQQNSSEVADLTRVRQLEVDIFKIIDQQVNEKKSPNSENKRIRSPSFNVLLENINIQKTLECHKKKFDEQKFEVSSSSDLDPLEKHSVSEDINNEKKSSDKKDSLQKEITDVDKDFFDVLLKRTKENAKNLSSHNSSLDQEDFTHFLKLLQEQSVKEDCLSKISELNLIVDQFDPLRAKFGPDAEKGFLEKELVDVESKKIIYELESPVCQASLVGGSKIEKLLEESSRKESSRHSSRCSSKRSSSSAKSSIADNKMVVNDKNELYTVGLTPRLELFADAIPKLLAEKTNEINLKQDEEEKLDNVNQIIYKVEDNEDFSFKNLKAFDAFQYTEVINDHKNVTDVKDFKDNIGLNNSQDLQDFHFLQEDAYTTEPKSNNDELKTSRLISALESRNTKNDTIIEKSKSYDQFSKQTNKLGLSFENMKSIKSVEQKKLASGITQKKFPGSKMKIQPKIVTKLNPKSKLTVRTKGEHVKPNQDHSFDVKGNQIRHDGTAQNSYGGGDWKGLPGEQTALDMLYQEERQKFMLLKIELEAEIENYKLKLKDMQMLNEQEMFALKKQNILLKAKVDELIQMNNKSAEIKSKYDPKIMFMQKELDRQENLISAYESENKKLMQEMKQVQRDLKSNNQHKQKVIIGENSNNQEIYEKLKDLQEENVKLNIEISDLKLKSNEFSLKNEDITQQNSLLQEELGMIKDQLRAKNDFITDRLQAMTTNELDLRRQVEDLKVEIHSKTEQLKLAKEDYDRLQQTAILLEKELTDLRSKNTYYQDKLQTAKLNCEREKQLTLKLKDQVILDNKNIMDLNRQVREMERILKRKNPDSVSALILTANSENEKVNIEKVKLLEDRISFLESEITVKEDVSQVKLSDIQRKFADMKAKYTTQVEDLQQKLKKSPWERKIYNEASTQTIHRNLESRGSEANLAEKSNNNNAGNKIGPKSQNPKEDTHLIATIRGLKFELANKEKTMSKITKDFQELQKTNRKLQREREKLLNERKNADKINNRVMTLSDSKLLSLKAIDSNDSNSNFYHNGNLTNGKKFSNSTQRLHDSSQFTENGDTNCRVKKLTSENEVLKEELSKINKDFIALKNKRLQDLNLLQEEHEKEIALIVKEYSIKVEDTKALKLQGRVNSQMAMISHLKQQIEHLQDCKEQVIILKAEREHLEGKNRTLSEKVKYLSTPGSQQLQLLQEKITILQQRHETRELSLQKLVRDLLRNKTQSCRDCKSAGDKGKELCSFRQELDNILGTLQNLTSP